MGIQTSRITMHNPFRDGNLQMFRDASLSQIMDFNDNQEKLIVEWLNNPKYFLIIYSAVGIGKTHICAAITNQRHEQGKYCYYAHESEWISRLIREKEHNPQVSEYLKLFCENEFFIWDDFGSSISGTKNNYEDAEKKGWLDNFIDYRYTSMLPTIITTNYTLNQIDEVLNPQNGFPYVPRTSSRLGDKRNVYIELFGSDKRQEGIKST